MNPAVKPLYIGGIFPLTGYLSWLGVYKKKASELKIEMINREGGINGRPLKLITYNDCSSEEEAAKGAEILINRYGVLSIIGTGSLPVSLAVARIANINRVPAFLNSGYTIDPLKDDFVFNTAHRTEFALACAFYYFLEKDISKIALLMPNNSLGETGSWLARHLSNGFGIKIVGEERFHLNLPEVHLQLERVKALKPQAIFSFVTGRPAAAVAGTMARMGFNIPLLISHGNATPSFLRMISSIPVKVIVPSGKAMALDSINQNDPSVQRCIDFNAIHLEKFKEPANYYSAEQADAIDLIVKGLKETGGRTEHLKDALEGIRDFVGMQGVYNLSTIDHYGTHPEDMVLLTVREGKWHLEKTFASVKKFDFLYNNKKPILPHLLAGILVCPSDLAHEVDPRELYKDLKTVDVSSHDKKHALLRTFYNHKAEIKNALKEEDEIKARQSLYTLFKSLEEIKDETFLKKVILELFFSVLDVALEKKEADIDVLIKKRNDFLNKWEKTDDITLLSVFFLRILNSIRDITFKYDNDSHRLLKKVMCYINKNYSENLTVERIANEVCLSPSYLIHKMKKSYNLSIVDCIVNIRIDRAKTLLKSTDVPIGIIAHEVGYSEQSYFSKVFKRYTGTTPREYRIIHRACRDSNAEPTD